MLPLTIEDRSLCPDDERRSITDTMRNALIRFNFAQVQEATIAPVILTVSAGSTICGGLIGRVAWDWLHIELLWLDASIRDKKAGKSLILHAETIAKNKGCLGVYLDTFSFQALGFYTKLGYSVFGQIDDQPQGHVRYFLKKRFAIQKI